MVSHIARRLRFGLLVLALALAACSDDGGGAQPDGGVDAGLDAPDAAVDLSAALFPRDRVLDVQITMAPADWAALRSQPRPSDLSDTTCARQPTAPGYTYYSASITIDGATTAQVGLRKKGNLGSLSTTRPGLRVKANEYVAGQRIAGLEVLTLNNNHQDDALISQCLGYELFAAAGLPASRCAFAHVRVNGEDLGVYSHVESVREEFLARHFADATGNLYESGGDFVVGATGGFQPKTNSTAPDCSDLDRVVTALGAPAAQLPTQLGAVVDLPAYARFWAMEVVTDHWDGYANNQNNFFIYHDPSTDKMSFIPWGIDDLFSGRQRTTRPYSVFACGSLPWKLYATPATRAQYLAALRDVLDTVWDAPAIVAEIDRMQALLAPLADAEFPARLDPIRAFVTGREAQLRAELAAGDPVWPYPAGEPSCRIDLGTITANFQATWGTLGMFGGSGSMSGTIAGVDVTTSTLLTGAGVDAEGKGALQLLGRLPDGRYAVIFVIITNPADVVPGTRAIDLLNVAAIMTFYDPVTDTATGGGLLLPGTLTLTQAATTPGAPIVGTVTGRVIEL
ncbi:MAG: CotH kinase family protein [Myxococcales bacterium]|nr:CotH kinase family protein [Myxococcales bacterium]MBK7192547.1 CotH kinase family protein [Myxococcales bacterium]